LRKPVVAGNWKMHLTLEEAVELARSVRERVAGIDSVDVGVCPPFPFIYLVKEVMTGTSIFVGAQNLHYEREGAFTGEVSAPMLESVNADSVIIGHSERRKFFGETNKTVKKRLKAAIDFGLAPILCVGENLKEREEGRAEDVVLTQLEEALDGFDSFELKRLIIAYEPVWAIGTGRTATPDVAEKMHLFIRDVLRGKFGDEFADALRILYGGSVKPDNIEELAAEADIDGALVGGASLDAESFAEIVRRVRKMKGD